MTARWAERCLRARTSETQALFGIVQGSIYPDLREISARQITALALRWLRDRWSLGRRAESGDARDGGAVGVASA